LVPVIDNKSSSRDLGAQSNGILVPVVPTRDCQSKRYR
jgi:hypothetical protein